jgi:hypothetical protein
LTGEAEESEDREPEAEPARARRTRLRRSPLGYRPADVDEALEERDRELAVLRQDVAALWLAFAQHDRMLRSLIDRGEGQASPAAAEPGDPDPPAEDVPAPPRDAAASIGAQLSELDEVLAAIEMATQTLEQTYAEEIRGARGRDRPERPAPEGRARED